MNDSNINRIIMAKKEEDSLTQEEIMQLIKIMNQPDIKPKSDSQAQDTSMSASTNLLPQETKKITVCEFENCRRRLSILDREFTCRCGRYFCGSHKFFDTHKCTFDYKGDYAKKLVKNNPKIEHNKIDKI